MKQFFTFIALLLSVTFVAFGNGIDLNKNSTFTKSAIEKQVRLIKSFDQKSRKINFLHQHRNLSQAIGLKSTLVNPQKLDSMVMVSFDPTTSQWFRSMKYEFSYEASKNTGAIYYDIDEFSGELMPFSKEEYSYNGNGELTQKLESDWDANINDWVLLYKTAYTYNSNGLVSQDILYKIDDTMVQWVELLKTTYIYNSGGKLTQTNEYIWDETTPDWIGWSGSKYNYDANSNLIQELNYDLDFTTFELALSGKTDYTYDANKNNTLSIAYNTLPPTDQFVEDTKSEYAFDSNGNMKNEINYHWDSISNLWVKDYTDVYNYNNDFTKNNILLPQLLMQNNVYFNHMLLNLDESNWDETTTQWVLKSKYTFHYSDQNSTLISGINSNEISVFPNPVSLYIQFNLNNMNIQASFELFDIQGRKLASKSVMHGEKIDMQVYSKGIYLYNLTTNGIRHTGKFIKD